MLAQQKHISTLPTGLKLLTQVLLSGLMLTGVCQAGQYYKWVDGNGVTHFSEKPVTGTEAKKMGTSSKTEEAAPTAEDAPSAETPAGSTPTAAQANINAENCKIAQERIKALKSGQRIRLVGDDGKFSYLDENQIKDELKKTQDVLTASCTPAAAP
ncbi:MAG: hypothetical protein RL497_1846 [Pseudomonadota bacterium]|jgi:hypothetical protein